MVRTPNVQPPRHCSRGGGGIKRSRTRRSPQAYPPPTTPSPPTVATATIHGMSVTEVLYGELARHRAQGTDFTTAWPHAATTALSTACDASDWKVALDATRDAWMRSYLRLPCPRCELAAGILTHRNEPGIPLEGRCATCAGPLPPHSRTTKLYCSDKCRRRVSHQHQRETIPA
jgi:predicted nucleic acid-binding Zn ribbon protein